MEIFNLEIALKRTARKDSTNPFAVATLAEPSSVVAADFDLDGHIDLAISD